MFMHIHETEVMTLCVPGEITFLCVWVCTKNNISVCMCQRVSTRAQTEPSVTTAQAFVLQE